MATKTYLCPKCGNHIELDDQALKAMGDSVVCANCQSVLKIEGDYAYVPLPQEHETAPAETPPPFHGDSTSEQPARVPSVAEITGAEHDPLYDDVIDYLHTCNAISAPMLARYFNITIERASHIIQDLEKNGIIGPYNGGGPREILIDHDGNLPIGTRRNYQEDQEMRAMIEKIKEENGGEMPKVRTFGCSCSTLIIILFAIMIIASIVAR